MAVTVVLAVTDNFRANLEAIFALEKEWSSVFGSKSEAPKPELSSNYVAGSSVGANKNFKGTL